MQPISNNFNRLVLDSPCRVALPLAVYPGLALTGGRVRDVVTDAAAQCEASMALHERYHTPYALTAMDLSAEAEAFGCEACFADNEVPFVIGRRVTSLEQAHALPVPQPGDGRTGVFLETVRRLKSLPGRPLVLGGCIGPFSLAARLVGVSEALELTITDPDLIYSVLEQCTAFLSAYAHAFRQAGADGLLMAEPAAGLLSPRGMSAFSSVYIKEIALPLADSKFAIILHNCAAKPAHLGALLATGLQSFHFGVPMDLAVALNKVPPEVVFCGNVDPAGVFVQLTPEAVNARAIQLLSATNQYRNFVLSSGCDVPASVTLANLDAFFAAVHTSENVSIVGDDVRSRL